MIDVASPAKSGGDEANDWIIELDLLLLSVGCEVGRRDGTCVGVSDGTWDGDTDGSFVIR